MSTEAPPIGPRLATLQREIESGNVSALDGFWQELAQRGTPLIEAINGDDKHFLVSFICRAPDEVKNVSVASQISGRGFLHQPLTRLLATDLWYRTCRVRSDLRIAYRYAFDGQEQPDPLNPHTQVFPAAEDSFHGDKDFIVSPLSLPDAPPQPWIMPRRGVAPGQLEHHRFHSEILGNERLVSVYRPAGYQRAGEPNTLLVLFDRWAYAQLMPTPIVLDNLIASGSIPPLVAVMISNINSDVREREMQCCNPSFAEFLAQELIPWVRRQ